MLPLLSCCNMLLAAATLLDKLLLPKLPAPRPLVLVLLDMLLLEGLSEPSDCEGELLR